MTYRAHYVIRGTDGRPWSRARIARDARALDNAQRAQEQGDHAGHLIATGDARRILARLAADNDQRATARGIR